MRTIGRYEIESEIGRGGMGVVYRGRDPIIGRVVAIKTIDFFDVDREEEGNRLRDRLFREAQSAGMLSHPSIVSIYDVTEEGSMAYVFMEFINGPAFDEVLHRNVLPAKEVLLSILRQTAIGLDFAHSKGVVHRDIKPANILIDEESNARITDFGVAKILSERMTQTGSLLGTPSYMSPEQVQGGEISGAADQFSLGVIAYQILAGQKPFEAESMAGLLFKICRDEFIPATTVNSTLSKMVEPVLQRVLAKDPEERYATCLEFIQELEQSLRFEPDWKVPIQKSVASAVPQNPAPQPAPQLEPKPELIFGSRDEPKPVPLPIPIPPPAPVLTQSPTLPTIPPQPPVPAAQEPTFYIPSAPPEPLRAKTIPTAPKLQAPPAGVIATPSVRLHEAAMPSGLPVRGIAIACIATVLIAGGYFTWKGLSAPKTANPSAASQGTPTETTPGAAAEGPPAPAPAAQVATKAADPLPMQQKATVTASNKLPNVRETRPVPPPVAAISQPQMTPLRIESTPPGAAVSLGDAYTCDAPCSLTLPAGAYKLVARLDGYRNLIRPVDYPKDQKVSLTLKRLEGVLRISSSPSGASIIIDGQMRAEKTPALLQLPAGSYKIQLVSNDGRAEGILVIHDGVVTQREYALH